MQRFMFGQSNLFFDVVTLGQPIENLQASRNLRSDNRIRYRELSLRIFASLDAVCSSVEDPGEFEHGFRCGASPGVAPADH